MPKEVVYSAQTDKFEKGRHYLNPKFFNGVLEPDTTSVIVVGDWPQVVAAYEKVDIPVRTVKEGAELPEPDEGTPRKVSHQVTTDQPGSVVQRDGELDPPMTEAPHFEIPENLDQLKLKELQEIAVRVDPEVKLKTKDEAIEFLEGARPKPAA